MDLLSSRPFWPIRDGLPVTFPPLSADVRCDVAVIGGGVSGALVAWFLTKAGFETIVLDRREVAHGSTAGNTGLILHEVDEPLHRLARRIGPEPAIQVYRKCRISVEVLEGIVREEKIECGFARRPSLFVAATQAHVAMLRREYAIRREARLPSRWWSRSRIVHESSLPHAAAIWSPGSAEMDVYRFTYGLLQAVARAGARIHDRTAVVQWKTSGSGVELRTSRQARVRARYLIVAAGYEAELFLPRRLGSLHSTFALVSEPVPSFAGWPRGRCLIWDTADPYLYLRTTEDNRAMIGGYDVPFRDPAARDRLLGAKVQMLRRAFQRFFPEIPLEVSSAWAGTFGVTADGLPFIGQYPGIPHTWFNLGFGGNGTLFSVLAGEILRDALLGRANPDAMLFRIGR